MTTQSSIRTRILLLTLAVYLGAMLSNSPAQIVYERGTINVNNPDQFVGWNFWGQAGPWWGDRNGDGDDDRVFGWDVGAAMWGDTGISLAPNTLYTATFNLNLNSWGASENCEQATLVMSHVNAQNQWSEISLLTINRQPNWSDFSISVDTSLPQNQQFVGGQLGLGIRVAEVGYISFDQVTLQASVVPEPSAIALLGLGSLGVLALRRRNP